MEWDADSIMCCCQALPFLNSPMLSDVSFIVPARAKEGEPPSKKAIPAHKVLLSICSPVFFSMFCGKMRLDSNTVELPDCEYEGVLEMLRHVYCGEPELTESNVMHVLYVAKKYMLDSLVEFCVDFIKEAMDPDNVFCILSNALFYIDERVLVAECWDLIDTKTEEAVQSEAFARIERSLLEAVVKRDSLTIEEAELFKAVDFWASKECERQGLAPNGNTKRNILGDTIVKRLRFPAMTEKEFASVVLNSRILTEEELIQIMKHFNSVLTLPLTFQENKRVGSYLSCFRFSEVGDGHELHGEQVIKFRVNQDIVLHGIRLFGSDNNIYEVNLKVKEIRGNDKFTKINKSKTLTSAYVQSPILSDRDNHDKFYTAATCTYSAIDFMFKNPLNLAVRGTRYRIAVKLDGPPTCCGLDGSSLAGPFNVKFIFNNVPNNTTTWKRGQFADFFFRLP